MQSDIRHGVPIGDHAPTKVAGNIEAEPSHDIGPVSGRQSPTTSDAVVLVADDDPVTQLDMAVAIQQLLLPGSAPHIPSVEIATRYLPDAQVGGDYFDFILRDDCLYFVVADVSGRGPAAALFMASARSTLRAMLPSTPHLLDLAEAVNRRVFEDAGTSGIFLTLALGCYDVRTHGLAVVNCGHPEPLLLSRYALVTRVPPSSPPVGVMEPLGAEQTQMTLGEGDVLCVCTDGLLEAAAPSGELFGQNRLERVLGETLGQDLETVAEAVLAAVQTFRGATALDNDFTLMLIRRRVCET